MSGVAFKILVVVVLLLVAAALVRDAGVWLFRGGVR